jgi:hypothetical protein
VSSSGVGAPARAVYFGDDVNPVGAPLFRKLSESVEHGRCILFLGAGVHHEPPPDSPYSYPESERPPLGGRLATQLAQECEFARVCPDEPDRDLQRVALCYQKVFDRQSLVEEIRHAVEDRSKPSAALRGLAELPFPLVMTTNYDTLFERALRREGKEPVVGVYNPRRYERTPDLPGDTLPTASAPFVFKAHGDINSPNSIVVTDEDYITFVLRMSAESAETHPIPETFRYWLNKWPTLFVGYRLLDFNLRLLFRTLRWNLDRAQRPSSYSVDVRPDPLVRDAWTEEHGLRFIVEDVWEFVPRLYRQVMGRELTP